MLREYDAQLPTDFEFWRGFDECGAGNPYRINRKPSEEEQEPGAPALDLPQVPQAVHRDGRKLHRLLGVHIRTAWFMMHRLRYAVAQPPLSEKLSGIIEADEVYVGGKPRTRQPRRGPRPADDPTARVPVVSFLERNGRVKSQPVERVTAATLREAIRDSVDTSSVLMTDESAVYPSVGKLFDGGHFTVNHSQREYARDGWITSNSVESYFARLRRSLTGTHHHVSRHHLHRYGVRTSLVTEDYDGKRA